MGFGDALAVDLVIGSSPGTSAAQQDPVALTTGWPLVGRSEELALLTGTVGRNGGSAVVSGAAGVGKSRLLTDLVDTASRHGLRTILVRATRSTATIPFGPFASWTSEPAGLVTTDRLQVLRITARALLDGDGPVVVAVDDAHLLDEGSAALVLHIAAHTPASVVVTVRTGEPSPDAVVALWKDGLATRVELQPLSETETTELSARVLRGPVDPTARSRLWLLTRGTPLYLRELLHAAVEQRVLAPAAGVWRWRGDLAGSGRLGELMGDRLADLAADERRALELVAIGEPLPLEVVAELGCIDAVAGLARRGLVVTCAQGVGGDHVGGADCSDAADCDDGHVACLTHPLYGEVVRADLPKVAARVHHSALACAAVAVGWHEQDPLRVAAWWIEGGQTPGPAEMFVIAARRALALGEWPLADRLARAAGDSGAGAEATLTRAAALVHLGGWGQIEGLLAEVSPDAFDDDDLQAEWARLHAGFLAWSRGRPEAGRATLARVATRLDAPARARTLAEAAYFALLDGDLPEAARLALEAMNDAGPSTNLRVRGMAVAAAACVLQGHTTAALRVAELASPFVGAALDADPYPDNPAGIMGVAYCLALVLDGRLDDAGAVAESALEPVLQYEAEARWSACASVAGRVALLRGRLALGRQRGRMGLVAAGPGPGSQWPAAVVAMAAAQLGDTAEAEAAIEHADASTPVIPLYAHEVTLARAWLRAAKGELSAARELAAGAADQAADAGLCLNELFALLDLARLGAPEAATARLAELATTIEGPYTAAVATFARASAKGDGDELDDVATRFEAMGALLLAAEAAAGAAGAHRASGRRGSECASLARARVLAARCDRARTPALGDVDVIPDLTTLTRREREVVELAGRGLTNREIASRLYVSVRTVNAHLGHAYIKLGTSNRHDLAALLPLARDPS